MKATFLKDIVEHKEKVNAEKSAFFQQIKEKISQTTYDRYSLFKKQISRNNQINLIAEIKKASPSKGLIRENFDVLDIARTYVKNKAAAISVLTEDKYFLGNPLFIKKVADNCDVPVLTKDFIIDEGQIFEAQLNGASAVLLIVAILDNDTLTRFIQTAASLDLDALVEIHNKEELKRAVACGAEIIGVNNRDLRTFEVNMKTAEDLIPQIPEGIITVAESGIKSFDDVKRLKECGVNAVLIGETFMREADIGAKIREIMNGC